MSNIECPFCGSQNISYTFIRKSAGNHLYHCKCDDCGSLGPRTLCKIDENKNVFLKKDKYKIAKTFNDEIDYCYELWNKRDNNISKYPLFGIPNARTSCPFCGNEPSYSYENKDDAGIEKDFRIVCDKCFAAGSIVKAYLTDQYDDLNNCEIYRTDFGIVNRMDIIEKAAHLWNNGR